MPDGRISQVRFEVLASRPGAFPFAARFKRWFAYAPTTNGLLSAEFHLLGRLMSALSPTTALPMAPPSTQSLFARSWRYLDQGDVYRLLRGHYSPVLALTDSFANPTRSPLLRPKPRSRSLCRLLPAPAAGGTFPTLSLRILPCVPGPLSRRSRGVHLPVSSSTSSAYPVHYRGRLPALTRQNDFMTDPLFETAAISLCSGPQVCSPPRSFLPPQLIAAGQPRLLRPS